MQKFYSRYIRPPDALAQVMTPAMTLLAYLRAAAAAIAAALLTLASASAQDRIILTDGTEVDGRVLEVLPEALRYTLATQPDGPSRTVGRASVFVVIYANGEREAFGAEPDPAAAQPTPPTTPSPVARPAVVPPTEAPPPSAGATASGLARRRGHLSAKSFLFGRIYKRDGVRIGRRDFFESIRAGAAAKSRANLGRGLKVGGAALYLSATVWGISRSLDLDKAQTAASDYNRAARDLGFDVVPVEIDALSFLGPPLALQAASLIGMIAGDVVVAKAAGLHNRNLVTLGLRANGDGVGLALTF